MQEQRQFFRLDINDTAEYHVLRFNGSEMRLLSKKPFLSKLVNLSAGGARIECDHNLHVNDYVELIFSFAEGTYSLLATVMWVRQTEYAMEVGLRFEIDEDVRQQMVKQINEQMIRLRREKKANYQDVQGPQA